jgi:hypothetical protein
LWWFWAIPDGDPISEPEWGGSYDGALLRVRQADSVVEAGALAVRRESVAALPRAVRPRRSAVYHGEAGGGMRKRAGPPKPKPFGWLFLEDHDADLAEDHLGFLVRLCRLSGLAIYRRRA